jgi:hypothetical protein
MTEAEMYALGNDIEQGRWRALSIRQPWPHRIFHEGKDIENRDWPTRYQGWFMIHAGVSREELDLDDPIETGLPRGGLVGLARIVSCVDRADSPWFFGRYGFVLRDAMPIPLIKCKGALGFFRPEQSVLNAVGFTLRTMALPS